MSTPKIILIHETVRQSWARDIGTFATFAGLWSLGYFAGSAALEWIGAIIALIVITGRAMSMVKGESNRMTPDQARAWLDKHFPTPTRDDAA